MNVSEATQLNLILAHALGPHEAIGLTVPSTDEARDAAVWLADRAHHTLSAGLTGTDVRGAWPDDDNSDGEQLPYPDTEVECCGRCYLPIENCHCIPHNGQMRRVENVPVGSAL